MTTIADETLAAEHRRLTFEQYELREALRDGTADPGARERLRAVTFRLREIAATPPEGYALPKLAADLVAHADAHGWLSLVQWTPPGYGDDPFVTVQVGRLVVESDGDLGPGDRWKYSLTWHSRGCETGKARLFGRILAETPDRPSVHDGPSVKAIRAVIEQHPAPAEG
jgi:hypothetical protein